MIATTQPQPESLMELRSDRRSSVTGKIWNTYKKEILPAMRENRRTAFEKRIEMRDMLKRSVAEAMLREVDPISIDDLDMEGLGEQLAEKDEHLFGDAWKLFKSGRRVEHVVDGMEKSQFPEFLRTCIEIGTIADCPPLGVDPILGLIGRMPVGCEQNDMATGPFLPEIPFGCEVPDEELNFMGVSSPLMVGIGPRCHSRIGFAFKEDLRCMNLDQAVRRVIDEQTRPRFQEMIAKQIVQILLGMPFSNAKAQKWAPVINCNRLQPFYGAGEGPWVNKICNDTDLDRCKAAGLICAIETLQNNAMHLVTGQLTDCCPDGWTSVVFGEGCNYEAWSDMLAPYTLEAGNCPTTGCGTKTMHNRSSRARWGEIVWHRYLYIYAYELFKAQCPSWTDAQIKQAVNRTFLAGCIDQAIKLTVERDFTRTTHGGPNSWMYFNQRVTDAVQFEHKIGFFIDPLKIQNVVLVQGTPDGIDCGACS